MPSTSSRGGAPMRRWLPLAVGSGLLLAGCTESRGPTQPAVRGAPTFDSEHGQGPRTHVVVRRGQSRGGHGGQGSGNTGIFYHGGPIIYNQNVAAIYWSAAPIYNGGPAPGTTGPGSADGSLVGFYMSNLGGSPYFNINTTYFDGSNTHINNVVNFTQYWASNTNLPPTDYSPLSDDAIIAQIEAGFSSGALTFDPSTLYIVFRNRREPGRRVRDGVLRLPRLLHRRGRAQREVLGDALRRRPRLPGGLLGAQRVAQQ